MLRIVIACGLLLFAGHVRAQANASVAVVSDDRYRGVSLSDGRPAVQASVGFDAADGAYLGAFASSARLDRRDALRWIAYGGRAGRFADGVGWDVGVQYSGVAGLPEYGYPELYAGLAGERLGARVAYARHYFGDAGGAWYVSFDAQQPLSSHFRLTGHAGWLRPVGDPAAAPAFDARLGVGLHVGAFDIELARTARHARGRGKVVGDGYRDRVGGAYDDQRPGSPFDRDAFGPAWVFGITRAW